MIIDRQQIYHLIFSFETDMREMCRKYIVSYQPISEVLNPEEIANATERLARDKGNSGVDLLDYLDLRPTYDLLNRHRGDLPESLAKEIRELTSSLEIIVPVRQRIMHARPLGPGDGEKIWTAFNGFTQRQWERLHESLRQVRDPNWLAQAAVVPVVPDEILHNLPMPDYDETGLFGREGDVDNVVKLITSRTASVVTITGEGGIGKTALALEVANRLLDLPEPQLDAILWVSLKKERLTGVGVKQIRNAVLTIQGAAESLGAELVSDFTGGVQELGEILEDLNVLICFDNLETISGEEFVYLYENLPPSIKYLVTSRNGVGQIERRYQLSPLSEQAALSLLNYLIKVREVNSLRGVSYAARKEIVKELRYSPLAVKWFVLAADAGRPALETIKNQDELLVFCVESVYRNLSNTSRTVLIGLDAVGKESSLSEIAIIVGEPVLVVSRSVQELAQGSLVVSRIDPEHDMETYIALTETAQKYLRLVVPVDDPERLRIADNELEYRLDEERRAKDASSRVLNPVIVRGRTPADSPTCQVLRRALLASHNRDQETALNLVDQARAMSPDFWEVDRVEAYIRSYSDSALMVSQIYMRALDRTESEFQRGIVAHFFSGHLAKNEHDVDRSLQMARMAHEAIGTPETLGSLGNALVRSGFFREGIDYLKEAINDSDGKSKLIYTTGLATAYRRWAEHELSEENNVNEAVKRVGQAVNVVLDSHKRGVMDEKLFNVLSQCLSETGRILSKTSRLGLTVNTSDIPWNEMQSLVPHLPRTNDFGYAARSITSLDTSKYPEVAGIQTVIQGTSSESGHETASQSGSIGQILSLHGSFGFVAHPNFPTNVFFPYSSLDDSVNANELQVGDVVQFDVEVADDGRLRASLVKRGD
ncbi:NB-ARC domain-containing protein [Kocuria sp. CPCC 205268]|uniref:NB-ARC domain-containing protein n=1 Tax=Kocuria oxytropis TaxID=3058913 RepID=UPI0034D7AFA1